MRTIRDCNCVVVGGAGFLGSHMVNHLIADRNCRVLVVDNLVAGYREWVHPKARFLHHDITGSEQVLLDAFNDANEEWTRLGELYVFNYAAYPYVPDSYAHPLRVADVNFMGAAKVINAAFEAGAAAILQVSSAEVYGDAGETLRLKLKKMGMSPASIEETGRRIDETCPTVPHSTYGASKAAIDSYCQVRFKEVGCPVIALRQFNCVGERETHPYVVPEIISQLSGWGYYREGYVEAAHEEPPEAIKQEYHNKPQVVRLGNDSFRDFMYAGDAVRIAVELLERGSFGEVYNLGSESGIKIYDLAKMIGKLMGFADVQVEQDRARVRPWEIWHLQSDNSKVKALYSPPESRFSNALVPLEESLRRAIAWFENNGRKWPWE